MKARRQQTRYMRFERDAYYTGLWGPEAPIRKIGPPGIGAVLARLLRPRRVSWVRGGQARSDARCWNRTGYICRFNHAYKKPGARPGFRCLVGLMSLVDGARAAGHTADPGTLETSGFGGKGHPSRTAVAHAAQAPNPALGLRFRIGRQRRHPRDGRSLDRRLRCELPQVGQHLTFDKRLHGLEDQFRVFIGQAAILPQEFALCGRPCRPGSSRPARWSRTAHSPTRQLPLVATGRATWASASSTMRSIPRQPTYSSGLFSAPRRNRTTRCGWIDVSLDQGPVLNRREQGNQNQDRHVHDQAEQTLMQGNGL